VAAVPDWLEVDESPAVALSAGIHKGEAAAIALASRLGADLLLMDDRKGVMLAERQGLNVTGTLGVLDFAAEHSLIDFAQTVSTFRMPLSLLDELLNKHKRPREE
jgi:predicted nucleic acid-binding protein